MFERDQGEITGEIETHVRAAQEGERAVFAQRKEKALSFDSAFLCKY